MQRFRAMTWPGEVPAVTRVETLGPYRLDGDLIKLDLDHAVIRTLDVPDELYLRELRNLDLDDSTAIIGFVNTFGRLGHRHPVPPRGNPDLSRLVDEATAPQPTPIIHLLGIAVPDESNLDWNSWSNEVVDHPSASDWGRGEANLFLTNGLQHIDAFRAWTTGFRVLADTYQRYLGLDADEQEFIFLAAVLEELLQPFSPRIGISYPEAIDTVFDPFEYTYPRLESVLALQMYRHIAAKDVYLRCANEPCGGLFVHQRGRAEYGQHRGSGVKYCSKNCAKAQVEREARRRRKKEQDN